MSNDAQQAELEKMVLETIAAEPAYFLVRLRVKPTNNVRVYIDGDEGITIEKCVQFNRKLYKLIEAAGLYPDGDFSLEVSSPGLDEPLHSFRQYRKNVGRRLEVTLTDGTTREGKLTGCNEEGIVLEEPTGKKGPGKGAPKKGEAVSNAYLFSNIKSTKIQVVF